MIECGEAVRRLWDYMENDVTPEARERVDEHLALCRRCCGELRFAEELQRILAERTDTDLPAPVARRLEEFVDGLEGASS